MSEHNGLADLQYIVQNAQNYFNRRGKLMLEHGWKQGPYVREQLSLHGFDEIKTLTDLQGHERMTAGYLPTGIQLVNREYRR